MRERVLGQAAPGAPAPGRPAPIGGGPVQAPTEAVVVLGCRLLDGGVPSPAAQRRIAEGAAAFHRSVAVGGTPPLVVASGGRRWGREVEAVAIADALAALAVPRDRIALELFSLSTVENARYTAEILRAHGIRRAAVVTCDWHIPRALRSFAAFDVEAFACPAASPAATRWTWLQRRAHEACSELLDAHLREASRRVVVTRLRG